MIEIQLSSLELEKLTRKIGLSDSKLIKGIGQAIKLGALAIQTAAKKKIQKGERTGRVYRIGKRGRTHTASAPGEPPKSNTGQLANSIYVNNRFFEADIGSDLKYAAYLQDGTFRMKARPWLQPSLEEAKPAIDKLLQKALKAVFK